MTAKTGIVAELGETAVLLPRLIGVALAANDRIKLRLTLLQEAVAHGRHPDAHHPGTRPRDFTQERRAAGLDDAAFDRLVIGARLLGADRIAAPGAAALLAGLPDDLAAMQAPLSVEGGAGNAALAARAEGIAATIPGAADDVLDAAAVDRLTTASHDGPDSLHLLVMDLHKALNRLAAATATEELDGARVHGLDDADRDAVRAFMRGLNRTAPLAFGHPGLGTMAVRTGGRLTIQNDIGTTDAHVLVVHVDAAGVTITYTDIHRPRAQFFIALFDAQKLVWSPLAERSAAGLEADSFYLVTGHAEQPDPQARAALLEFLGSRIVFLIDWNKARKALQNFVGRNAAITLLTRAAQEDAGHRAFLELGGADLVLDAVHRAAAGRIPYGVRLDAALGEAACLDFLQGVLRETSRGLAAGRTARLIRDAVRTALAHRFETAGSAVLTVLVRHLGLSRMLASLLRDALASPALATASHRQALARRAKQLEEKADRLTVDAREIAAKLRDAGLLRPVIDAVENTADALEDAAFLLGIAPEDSLAALAAPPLLHLAEIATDSTGQLVRAVEAASRLSQGVRADAMAALQAIDAVALAEHAADAAQRETFAAFMAAPPTDARVPLLGLELARCLELATDHLSHAALALRDRVLEELSA